MQTAIKKENLTTISYIKYLNSNELRGKLLRVDFKKKKRETVLKHPKVQNERRANSNPEHSPYIRAARKARSLPNDKWKATPRTISRCWKDQRKAKRQWMRKSHIDTYKNPLVLETIEIEDGVVEWNNT